MGKVEGKATLLNGTDVNISSIAIAFTGVQPSLCKIPIGTATAVVTGGVSGYTYLWQDSQSHGVGNTETLQSAAGGIYKITVEDSHLCKAISYVPITSFDGAKSSYESIPAKCFDSSDGSAIITITSGVGPFIINWRPDGQSTLHGTNLKQGSYDVLIEDANKCTVVQTVAITAPPALQVNVKNETMPSCNAICDGQLELEALGGVGSYTYQWNNKPDTKQTQLCAGKYPLMIKDGNGCSLSQTIELKQPEPLEVTVIKETPPTCKDGCDGSLEVAAKGGNGNYQYAWALGGSTNIKKGLCPGSHVISVTDPKGCSIQRSINLRNTPPLQLDLGGGITVCVGQKYSLDAGNQWTAIKWKSNTGFTSTQQKIVISDPGSYWLETLNDKGCIAQDTFLLATSTDLMQASFMMPGKATVRDTVAIIEISWPLPESIEWDYPVKMRKIKDSGDVVLGQFNEAGTYAVSLTARLGGCLGQITKTITILDDGNGNAGGRLGTERYVKEFVLYPSPNDGSFEVGVELIEENPISLSVWSSTNGILIRHVNAKGHTIYKLSFDLRPLGSGEYVLRLDHAKGSSHLKFIIY